MTRHTTPVGAVLVVAASAPDAVALAPLAERDPADGLAGVLVATGPDPMAVDLALDDLGALCGHVLLVDEGDSPAAVLAALLPRLDALLAEERPVGVVVRGGSTAAFAAAQTAVWRGVPVAHVPAPEETGPALPTQAAVAALVAWQRAVDGPSSAGTATLARLLRRLAPPPAPTVGKGLSEAGRAGS